MILHIVVAFSFYLNHSACSDFTDACSCAASRGDDGHENCGWLNYEISAGHPVLLDEPHCAETSHGTNCVYCSTQDKCTSGTTCSDFGCPNHYDGNLPCQCNDACTTWNDCCEDQGQCYDILFTVTKLTADACVEDYVITPDQTANNSTNEYIIFNETCTDELINGKYRSFQCDTDGRVNGTSCDVSEELLQYDVGTCEYYDGKAHYYTWTGECIVDPCESITDRCLCFGTGCGWVHNEESVATSFDDYTCQTSGVEGFCADCLDQDGYCDTANSCAEYGCGDFFDHEQTCQCNSDCGTTFLNSPCCDDYETLCSSSGAIFAVLWMVCLMTYIL